MIPAFSTASSSSIRPVHLSDLSHIFLIFCSSEHVPNYPRLHPPPSHSAATDLLFLSCILSRPIPIRQSSLPTVISVRLPVMGLCSPVELGPLTSIPRSPFANLHCDHAIGEIHRLNAPILSSDIFLPHPSPSTFHQIHPP